MSVNTTCFDPHAALDANRCCTKGKFSMDPQVLQSRARNKSAVPALAWIVLVCATLVVRPVSAQTYISAEPIPSAQIVGTADLGKIEGLAYSTRALWSQRLLN